MNKERIAKAFKNMPTHLQEISDKKEIHLTPYLKDWFFLANGASKMCLVPQTKKDNFVLKWATDEYYNEAEEEYENYLRAVELGIEKVFPETIFVGYTKDGTKIYAQELVKSMYDISVRPSEGEKKLPGDFICHLSHLLTPTDRSQYSVHAKWVAHLVYCYGRKFTYKLIDFIRDNDINDLHSANIGYNLKKQPKILDFSGYHQD